MFLHKRVPLQSSFTSQNIRRPRGTTLVQADNNSSLTPAVLKNMEERGVFVISRAEELQGKMYKGGKDGPPCRGKTFELPGHKFAVSAWASHAVTRLLRQFVGVCASAN